MSHVAAVYGRQSRDKKTSIDQQVEIGLTVCADEGWAVHGVYKDGVSASRFSNKSRPDWERLKVDLEAGRFDLLWLWEPSRGDRDLSSWVELLDRCRELRVSIYVHTAERVFDIRKGIDWKTMVDAGTDSAYESEKTSTRILRMTAARAKDGKPHGKQAYGYRRVPVLDADGQPLLSKDNTLVMKDVLHPAQAAVIREASTRVLNRESMRSIVMDLNARGIETPRGNDWDGTMLRQVLLRERNAGRRVHRVDRATGRPLDVFKADWEPILDEGTFDRVKALLTDSSRRTARGNSPVHLMSGLAACGLCGGTMRVVSRKTHNGKTAPAAYNCRSCYRIRRKQEDVDAVVNAVVVARLSQPDGPDLLAGDPDGLREASEQAATLEARLNLAADQYADGDLTGEQLNRITARLRPQIADARDRARAAAPSPELASILATGNIAEAWGAAPLDAKRAVIGMVMTVTIEPTGKGSAFDPRSVRVDWRQRD